jgi:NTE family protein
MKIGMALSGGGARGIAHLGVIHALQEEGVKIDVISGTSAGAIAGAFIAQGYKPKEVYDIIGSTGILKSVRPAWSLSGLLTLDGFKEVLIKHIPHQSFEGLQIPLIVAATDLLKGAVCYFSEGNLITPVVASSCIPALFNPVAYQNSIYIDGGIVDNLPVRPLVGNCDFVIAVHTNPIGKKVDIKNMREVTERSLLLAINMNSGISKSLSNLVIEPPELANYTTLDISKAKEIFDIGYQYIKQNQQILQPIFQA